MCSFALADSLGRPAVSGECDYSDALAAEVERCHVVAKRSSAAGNLNGYLTNISLGSPDILTSSYYDDYSFLPLGIFSRLYKKLVGQSLPSHKTSPTGLPTATWKKVLGPPSNLSMNSGTSLLIIPVEEDDPVQSADSLYIAQNGFLESTSAAFYYDSRDRLIATATVDHLGGLCLETSTYNNGGLPLTKRFKRQPLSARDEVEDHTYTYVYDSFGRPKSLKLTRGDSVYTVHANSYDDIGQLSLTDYGNGCRTSYSYKVAGALASITSANAAGNATFSQTLRYAAGDTPSYSGNVGGINWRGDDKVNRSYGFTYDGVGRLVSATYSEPDGRPSSCPATGVVSYNTSYTYGPDSRPLTVRRHGVRTVAFSDDVAVPDFGEVDNLTFNYSGSRLTMVYDAAEDIVYTGAADFNDGADASTEYTYDEDGRLTSDANKGISYIYYNAIGLPSEVNFSDGSSIANCYSADGTLLQRVHTEHIPTLIPLANFPIIINPPRPLSRKITENHIGPQTIRKISQTGSIFSRAVSRVDTPNGFISSERMYYYVKDYQGNVRQVTDADGAVVQDNHYYPYGMLMGESSDVIAYARGYYDFNFNPYLYGSKEYLTTGGANLLDFTARTYDPSTLLFHTQDPNATDYTPLHSYLYCGSDPVNRIDPSGQDYELLIDGIKNTITISGIYYVVQEDLEYLQQGLDFWNGQSGKYYVDGFKVNFDLKASVADSKEQIQTKYLIVTDALRTENSNSGNSFVVVPRLSGNISGLTSKGNEIGISKEKANEQTAAHEIGHTLGLQHSTTGLMTPAQLDEARSFSIDKSLIRDIIVYPLQKQRNGDAGQGQIKYLQDVMKLYMWNFNIVKR